MTVSDRLDRLPLGRFHYRLLILCGLGWLFDALDSGLMSFVLPSLKSEWNISATRLGLMGSAALFGMMLGGGLSGYLSDRFGRKAVFQWTLLIFTLATGLCALAWGYWSLLILRVIVGFGLGGELPVAAALISEFAPSRHRGRLIVLLESFWAWLSGRGADRQRLRDLGVVAGCPVPLAQVPGYFTAAYLVEKIGRKLTLGWFMVMCAVASYFFGGSGSATQIVVWGCLVSFFNLGAWGVTYSYTPELYPTHLRGTGTGSAAAFGRIGAFLAPMVVGWIVTVTDGRFGPIFTLFAAVLVFGALAVLILGEETRGRTLEQISG